jgi:hypothetical protein
MAFQVPAAQQSIGQDLFTFGPVTGDEYSVTRSNVLTIGQLEELDDSKKTVAFFGPENTPQGDYVRSLTKPQLESLIDAWRADSGVTAGEP